MAHVGLLREDLQFAMDLEFFCRLHKHGPLKKVNRFLGCLRCHSLSKSATILHVGRDEAQREWRRLYGTTPATERNVFERMQRKVSLLGAMLRHPQLIAWPYVVRRLLKGRRGML